MIHPVINEYGNSGSLVAIFKIRIEGCGFKFSVAAYTRATRPPSVKITVTNGSLEIYVFACVYSGDIPPLVKRNYVKKHVSRVDSEVTLLEENGKWRTEDEEKGLWGHVWMMRGNNVNMAWIDIFQVYCTVRYKFMRTERIRKKWWINWFFIFLWLITYLHCHVSIVL